MSIASVFVNGGSQAVRIPKEFRFETNRVSVQAVDGGLLLLPIGRKPALEEFFARCDELDEAERTTLSSIRRQLKPQRRAFCA